MTFPGANFWLDGQVKFLFKSWLDGELNTWPLGKQIVTALPWLPVSHSISDYKLHCVSVFDKLNNVNFSYLFPVGRERP